MENWIATHITLPIHMPTISEEKENAYSHFLGLFLSMIGFAFVLGSSGIPDHDASKAGMVIFALSNIVLYAASAFYHIIPAGTAKKALRVFDHSAIYILIAGSYTPLLMYIGTQLTIAFTAAIWGAALIGILTTLRFWGRFYPVHIALYALMGWSVVLIWNDVMPYIPRQLFLFMLSGGITYTVGIIFYSIRKIPHNHLIWHLFVLGGSIWFFAGYCTYLLA